ncbi:MAG: adenylate kinase [Propionibacterium sp.]|nr:adenylate kinase [Propionibacterium sp.]
MLIMGPPGAGKGTQAKGIAEHYGVPAISTGDIFRSNVANETELGLKVKAIMAAGDYVSDEITNDLVANRLTEADTAAGFLLDGYPRTLAQVDALDGMLQASGKTLDAVIALTADNDELVARLLNRAKVEGREDDNEDAIRRRLEVYDAETRDLLEVYRERGLLVEVDGLGEIDAVGERIREALAAHRA